MLGVWGRGLGICYSISQVCGEDSNNERLHMGLSLHGLHWDKAPFQLPSHAIAIRTSTSIWRCQIPAVFLPGLTASQIIPRRPRSKELSASPTQIAKGPVGRDWNSRHIFSACLNRLVTSHRGATLLCPMSPISTYLFGCFFPLWSVKIHRVAAELSIVLVKSPFHLVFGVLTLHITSSSSTARPTVPSIHYEVITVMLQVTWKGPLRELGRWFSFQLGSVVWPRRMCIWCWTSWNPITTHRDFARDMRSEPPKMPYSYKKLICHFEKKKISELKAGCRANENETIVSIFFLKVQLQNASFGNLQLSATLWWYFCPWDWFVSVEPWKPRFGPLFKNAASSTVLDVSIVCPDLCCLSSRAQTDTPALPQSVSEEQAFNFQPWCSQRFPSLQQVKGRHLRLHLVDGNMMSQTFTGTTISDFNRPNQEFQLPPNQPWEYYHARCNHEANHLELISTQSAYRLKKNCWLDWGCSDMLATTDTQVPNIQVTRSTCKLLTYESVAWTQQAWIRHL